MKMGDTKEIKQVKRLLGKANLGVTIAEFMDQLNLGRTAVRVALAKLEGEKKIFERRAGTAKIYFLKDDK